MPKDSTLVGDYSKNQSSKFAYQQEEMPVDKNYFKRLSGQGYFNNSAYEHIK